VPRAIDAGAFAALARDAIALADALPVEG
jgi:hypothetical protein